MVVYAVVLFVFVDFRIALVILLASLLAVFVPRVTAGELSGRRKSYQSALGRYTARVQDLLSGFRFVNRHTCGPMAAEHDRTAAETEEAWLHFGRFKSFVIVFNNFVMDIVRCPPLRPLPSTRDLVAGNHRRHRRRNAWLHRELYPAGTVYP